MTKWTGLEEDNPAGIQNVDFMTLEPHQCRWPVRGDLFCGALQDRRSSYCPQHRQTGKRGGGFRADTVKGGW